MNKFWVLGVLLTKGKIVRPLTGYAVCETPEQAKRSFLEGSSSFLEEDFCISEISCVEVPREVLLLALEQ